MPKLTAFDIQKMKGSENKISMLTAYDFGLASIFDEAKIDMLLVGDTMGMVFYGKPNTLEVTLDMTIMHCRAVAEGAKNHSLVVGDLPFLTFGVSIDKTVENAGLVMKKGKAEAVKLEGASDNRIEEIEAIIDAGIPVQGHIGLLPQSAFKTGGYKVQGKKGSFWDENDLIDSAKKLEKAGCFSLVLEAIPQTLSKKITEQLKIPTIGIGAGIHCDGQVLVSYDMLGYLRGHKPKFVKQYASLHGIILQAAKEYHKEVQKGTFPTIEYSYED